MTILLFCLLFTALSNGLKVTSFNIWNTMFNWNVRKLRIIEMIRSVDSDVISLQEVRAGHNVNQMEELRHGLPSHYKWSIFKAGNNISFVDQTIDRVYFEEGIGIISRLPIVETSVHYILPHPSDPDKNRRLVLHARVQDLDHTVYDILAVHFSYHRQQQCRNMEDVVTFIKKRKFRNVIVLGDFNAYNDYEGPTKILAEGEVKIDNPCWKVKQDVNLQGLQFQDAWRAANPNDKGLTFSNMPSPGMESRPDRIFVEASMKVVSAILIGNGTRYKQRYKAVIHWSRFTSIIQSAFLSYQGVAGFSCKHDCGPRGSCLCGVCVAIGNKQDCMLPDCVSCSSKIFKMLVLHCVLYVVVLLHLFYSVFLLMTVASLGYTDTLYSILGFKCCLFNPQLCKCGARSISRRHKVLKNFQIWPIFRLPPYMQILLSVTSFVLMFIYSKMTFSSMFNITYNLLEEELYPSDHLMVTAEIKR